MSEAIHLDLVRKAIVSGLSNCLEWVDEQAMVRVANDVANRGVTPAEIRLQLIAFARSGGAIEQRREERPQYQWRREHWYRAVIPMPGFEEGLFVEMELFDEDPDVPIVMLLNAHPQKR